MNWYDRHLLPYLIDMACGLPMVQKQRRQLVPQAQGRVLGVGIGTGRNLPFYDRSRITRLVGVDPAMQMHRLAQKRSQKAGIDVELMGLSAEQLPTTDASFDTVVCTYTLCSIPGAGPARDAPGAGAWRQAAVLRAWPSTRRRRAPLARPAAAAVGALGRGLPSGARHSRAVGRGGLCGRHAFGLFAGAAAHDFSLLGPSASGLNTQGQPDESRLPHKPRWQ